MSTPGPTPVPQGQGQEADRRLVRRLGVKGIALIVLAAYALLLALFNLDAVEVNFVVFSTRASLFVVIALAAAIGFLAGYIFDSLRSRRSTKG